MKLEVKTRGWAGRSAAGLLAVVASVALAACGTSTGNGGGGSSQGKGAPYSASFKWGKFSLSSRIAEKIKGKEPLNFVLSYQILNEPGAPSELTAGMKEGAKAMEEKYGVKITTNLIGPPETDPPTQISQITQELDSQKIDCGGVEPASPGAFVNVINQATGEGVPMMTVNTDSPESHRLAYFGPDDSSDLSSPLELGTIAGNVTVEWAKENKVDLNGKEVALVTGEDTAAWAQARMKNWEKVVKEAFPHVKVLGTPTNTLSTGYTPATILSDVTSYVTGHPNVVFYFDSDWGAAQLGQLIHRQGLKGKVATIGYNIDQTYITDLKQESIIATIDQRYDLQAKSFVEGCANFLLGGKAPSEFEFVKPSVWTPKNVGEALKLYSEIPNSGV